MENNSRKYLFAAGAILVCGFLWFFSGREKTAGSAEGQADVSLVPMQTTGVVQTDPGKVYIHITGAVKKPGVYIFDTNPRVIEVVEKAGGFKKNANQAAVNQAEVVEDGTRIQIETRKKKSSATGKKTDSQSETVEDAAGLVSLNTATKEELMTLTGIGESKAMAIISYRETNGLFRQIEDVMNITGIKTGVYDKIKNQIKV